MYKVFLVEDEVVAREGIRDKVDWKSAGFEFCGEAPDGEIALPLIEASQPDVLITDIKMPFMDGLQLCKIIREHMAWVKIIVLSGYDEFSYAQTALKLGVTDYLLKPVGAQDLHKVLKKLAVVLNQEQSERETLKRLRNQVEDNLVLLREKFLLRLVMGGESLPAALEQSQQLGLELPARCYQVMLIKMDSSPNLPYSEYQRVEGPLTEQVRAHQDVLLAKKDLDEWVVILKGESPEQLEQEGMFLADLIQHVVQDQTGHRLSIGLGKPQQRLGDLHRSFAEALVRVQEPWNEVDNSGLRKLDQAALKSYLEIGTPQGFDAFFDDYVQPVGETALRSYLFKHYILLDMVLSNAQFVSDLGGDVDQVVPEIPHIEEFLLKLQSMDQIRLEMKRIFTRTLTFRDSNTVSDRAAVIHQAKSFIDGNYSDPNLSLNNVASQVNFSPSHFSAVFSHETGETFKDYLTRMRIEQAKKLLRTTRLKVSEVAYQCGYHDAHYFSLIFRKNTGQTPQQFRA